MHLSVTLVRRHGHATDGVILLTALAVMAAVAIVPAMTAVATMPAMTVAMNPMRAATAAHHQVEQDTYNQVPGQTVHIAALYRCR